MHTRGRLATTLGCSSDADARPQRAARTPRPGAQRQAGLEAPASSVPLASSAQLAGIKHGNRLEQVLAAEYARRAGVDEAIMLDQRGRPLEAIAGNLVLIIDGQA